MTDEEYAGFALLWKTLHGNNFVVYETLSQEMQAFCRFASVAKVCGEMMNRKDGTTAIRLLFPPND